MFLSPHLLSLPPCLLLSILSSCTSVHGQDDRPSSTMSSHLYHPYRDDLGDQAGTVFMSELSRHVPIGVKKMSSDPEEKFFPEYWTWEASDQSQNLAKWTNRSLSIYDPPAPLHCDSKPAMLPIMSRALRSALLGGTDHEKRNYQCPSGSFACNSINRPNLCCTKGSICQIITDTGLGDVGCCNEGSDCSGQLTTCPFSYTGCPANANGGCCIPGYACDETGCVLTSTAVVYVTSSSSSTADPVSISTTTIISTVIVSVYPPDSTVTIVPSSTTMVLETSSVQSRMHSKISTVYMTVTAYTTSHVSNSLTCSSGFRSCSGSDNGFCCPSSLGCGPGRCLSTAYSTASFVPPVRGTTAETTMTQLSSLPQIGCPTGFYACSAFYLGGCCQIGQDCHSSSCPALASTSLIVTNGITIVAPRTSGVSQDSQTSMSRCPYGWFSCLATDGGGCCPSGFACGVSCTSSVSASGTNVVAKEAPTGAGSRSGLGMCRVMIMAMALCGIFLTL